MPINARLKRLLRHLRAVAEPTGICLGCNLPGQRGRDLCRLCEQDLPWNQHPCPTCAHPRPSPQALCTCHPKQWPFRQVLVGLVFQAPVTHWVHQLKFQESVVCARLLAQLQGDLLQQHYTQAELPDLVLPTPSHWRRVMARGANQTCLLGAPLARRLGVPFSTRYLRRTRHLPSQQGLSRTERERNLASAFRCRRSLLGQSIAIVDDVLTTGATARSLAETCLAAGAHSVDLWCVARTARPATLRACQI